MMIVVVTSVIIRWWEWYCGFHKVMMGVFIVTLSTVRINPQAQDVDGTSWHWCFCSGKWAWGFLMILSTTREATHSAWNSLSAQHSRNWRGGFARSTTSRLCLDDPVGGSFGYTPGLQLVTSTSLLVKYPVFRWLNVDVRGFNDFFVLLVADDQFGFF